MRLFTLPRLPRQARREESKMTKAFPATFGKCFSAQQGSEPLSCIQPVVMQKASQAPNWTENPDHAVKTEYD